MDKEGKDKDMENDREMRWISRKKEKRDRGEKEKYYIRINLILSNQIKKTLLITHDYCTHSVKNIYDILWNKSHITSNNFGLHCLNLIL